MDIIDTLNISGSGLSAQRVRLQAVSSNMANARTTRTDEGGPYQRRMPVFKTESVDRFGSELQRKLGSVEVTEVRTLNDVERVFDPTHPDADDDGFVAYPAINILEEMVDLMTTARTYEANLKVLSTTQQMANQAIELGR
ncbi:MAG: flagellar basal body rod protein FlgC [Myxococcota bacterium]|nr:flagellar basal body rod protein FlgC [Myxococcota bacterium]